MKSNARTGKRTFAMNIFRKLRGAAAPGILAFVGIAALGFGALLFGACENPFRAGLGAIVDMHYPTVNLVSPAPGSPVRGQQRFAGVAWDDMVVEAVQFMISPGLGYEDLSAMLREGYTEQDLEERNMLGWQEVKHLSSSRDRNGNWTWEHVVYTRIFRDGPLNIRFKVRDAVGNEVEVDDIVFFIRNNPPVISMDFPRIGRFDPNREEEQPGTLGSGHLNFDFATDFSRLYRGVDPLVGVSAMITDDNGLSMPPQFRIWEVFEVGSTPQGAELPDYRRFPADVLPTAGELPWRDMTSRNFFLPTPAENPTSLLFFYDFPNTDTQGRFFAMQIRAQSSIRDGSENYETHFPRDEWGQDRWADWSANSPERYVENSFVAFLVEAPQAPPQLELLRFQDILRSGAWNAGLGDYDDKTIDPNEAHVFLAETANVKRGPFTLRVRSSHLEGISETVAFWEDGRGERGLFIWDVAEGHRNSDNDVCALNNRFTMWGFADPHRHPLTRNFIFTYRDDADHDFHGDDVHESASGRYRIQRFTGTNWNELYGNIREPGGWDSLLASEDWADANDFWGQRGAITIRVYARAALGRVSAVPLITTVSIDRDPPVVALGGIDGLAGEYPVTIGETTYTAHIVNGVIMVRLSVDDIGSGLRYTTLGDRQIEDVRFVLVGVDHPLPADRDFWSLDKDGLAGLYAYGPVVDRGVRMRTSRTHGGEALGDLLQDGRYWLYVFARDMAFNVGRERFLLEVDAESDRPRFDFDVGINPNVTTPNTKADVPGDYYGSGFRYGGAVRNRLRPADNVRFTVRDDDSLDLGVAGGAASSLRISIVGSFVDEYGHIHPLDLNDSRYRLYLSDAQIKSVFPPQGVVAGNRVPVREWTGTITQAMFLEQLRNSGLYDDMLRDHPSTDTRLPDGIFRINMEVWDDPSNKLTMRGDETADAVRSLPVEFWIVVDERRPVFDVYDDPRDGGFISARDDVFITGTVSDVNGPITPLRFEARHNVPGGVLRPIELQHVNLDRTDNDRVWEYDFSARIRMDEIFPGYTSGEFVFYLTVRDRFGNEERLRRMYLMDNVPPTLALRPGMSITTFQRSSAANRIPADSVGRISAPDVNAGRLANRVLHFAVDAADNFAVAGIHWWLLPANVGAVTGGLVDMPGGGTVASFGSFPSVEDYPQVTLGTRGAFGRIAAPGGEAFIDTSALGLPDGEYRLHIIVRDEAGNESIDSIGVTSYVQTIFLFQDEDRPYFTQGIRPDGGRNDVRGHDLVLTGVITDDDGFGTGMFPDEGTVQIWVSTNNNLGLAEGEEPSTDVLRAAGWSSAVPTHLQGLGLIDGTNLVLDVDLQELDWNPPFVFGEGMKFYVLRAQDSHVNKLAPTGGPAASTDRAVRYSRVFEFMRDVQPPVLTLTAPDAGHTFGVGTFYITGSIADANLRRYGGNPYLLWRLNGVGALARFELTAEYIAPISESGGIETVQFRIPHTSMFGDAGLIQGPNTLELRVEDMTGASAELSRGFIRDTTPPEVNFRAHITTFERRSAAYRIPADSVGIVSSAADNAARLANQVLDFAVDATDNIAVGGIHWWLVPADADIVDSFWSYPAGTPDAPLGVAPGIAFGFNVGGVRGAFGRILPPGGAAIIDTTGLDLPDGEYRLHVIAVDGAGNPSDIAGQTIFLFQDEDRPYFTLGIRPDDEVRGNDIVITGVITDDDGFGAGMFPDPDSVRIWISTNNNLNLAEGEEPSTDILRTAGWSYAVPTHLQGLNLIDGTNLVLDVDLQELDWNPPFVFGEGMKFYVIRAQDSHVNKLAPTGGPAASTDRAVRYSRVFEFMRDVQPPELTLTAPEAGQAFGQGTFYITGSIADANLSRYPDRDGNPYLLWRLNGQGVLERFELTAAYIDTRSESDGIETLQFSIPHTSIFADGSLNDGANTLELRVEDMTGASAELSRGFIRDISPPILGVRTGITTFRRDSAAYRMNGGAETPSQRDRDNAARLANRVLNFAVDATDNSTVGGIHWWLVPAGADIVDSFWSYPAGTPDAPLDVAPGIAFGFNIGGVRGAFGRIAPPGGEAIIDTYIGGLNLPDGEYRLHVIAVDGAGNESRFMHPEEHLEFVPGGYNLVQTIFLFQDEDRPYFASAIRPDGEVRGNDMVITGVITDDDGFGTGMFPEDRSVQIWISRENILGLAPGARPDTEMLEYYDWHRAYVPTGSGQGLALIDGTNLVLDINLQNPNLTWEPPFVFDDGIKHFVIRVQDSAASKLAPAGGPAASDDRVHSYSQVFSFMRDTTPPELTLNSPVAGQAFGVGAFYLEGSIADANLRRHDGNPYLLWRLNGQGVLARLPLVAGDGVTVTSQTVGGIETVSFSISPARILDILGSDTTPNQTGTGLRDGANTLELRVEDMTGASHELSRGFIRDISPPTLSVRTEIATFRRDSAAGRIPADSVGVVGDFHPYTEENLENRERLARVLANRVLGFAVDATDNIAVGGIHWWLVPADADIVDSFSSYPAGTSGALAVDPGRAFGFNAAGVRGAFGRIALPGGEAFIDTTDLDLPAGEYRLHVIAVDGAGNESVDRAGVTSHVQTIFLFQDEDRPYFASPITPDGGVRGDDLVITGVITDDDGFGTGIFPDAGSVEIWISTSDLGLNDGEELDSEALRNAGWHRAVLDEGHDLTLIDGTSIVLNVNLLATNLTWIPPNPNATPFAFGQGMKHYVIRVQDSVNSSLWVPGTPANERGSAVSYSRVFSFMRDTLPPVLTLDSPMAGQAIADDYFDFEGTIADANLARHNFGTDVAPDYRYFIQWRLNGQGALAKFPAEPNAEGVVNFRIPISTVFDGVPPDGNHFLELRVEDMAGLSTEISRSFIIDRTPPTVDLRPGMEIATFRRDSAADRIPADSVGIISDAGDNARRLANRVIRFAADATDNTVVEAIHWWLLPANVGSDAAGDLVTMPGGGTMASFWSYPEQVPVTSFPALSARAFEISAGVYGAFGRIAASGGVVHIDTYGLDLPDGEYRLHVIARDQAGNESVWRLEGGDRVPVSSLMQTIFLFQAEDRPYFTPGIRPDGGLYGNNIVVTGVITDDDGFGTGMFPDPGSVQIWISRENNLVLAPGARPDTEMLEDAGWHMATVPSTPGGGLSLIDGTNLVLEIDLLSLFPTFFVGADGNHLDGMMHYVIRVQDSAANKLAPAGGPAASDDRVYSYSWVFSFIRDVNPPVLTLTHPAPGQAIHPDDLVLRGSIADANLMQNFGTEDDPDYRFHMQWRLNNPAGVWNEFPSANADMEIVGGLETVEFDLLNADVWALLGAYLRPNNDNAGAVNTLELRVMDLTGAVTEYSRTFIIDDVAPVIELNIERRVPLAANAADDDRTPEQFFAWWWTEPTTGDVAILDWNNARREWAEDSDLPVVELEGRIAWLAGSFSDENSDIDLDSMSFRINNAPERPIPQSEGSGGLITWRIPLTVGGTSASDDPPLPNGVHTVSIRVADMAGNAAKVGTYAFRIDGDDPDVRIDPPANTVFGVPANAVDTDTAFTIEGTATDANLREVTFRIYRQGAAMPVLGPIDLVAANSREVDPDTRISLEWLYNVEVDQAVGDPRIDPLQLRWSFDVTRDVFFRDLYNGEQRWYEGEYEIRVTAVDWRGEVSEMAIWQFTKDATSPEISFPGRATLSYNLDPVSDATQFAAHYAANRITNIQSGTIQVTIGDDNEIRSMQRQLERWTWDSPTAGSWSPVDASGTALATGDDGWTVLTVGGPAGGTIGGTARNRTWGMPVGDMPEGLYRLRIRALDASWFDFDGPEGIDFADNSRGNPGTSEWLYFFRDTAVPTVEFSLPLTMSSRFGTGTGDQGFLGFNVTADDSNTLGLRQLTVRIDYRIPDPNDPDEYLERSGTVTVNVFAGDHDRTVNVFNIRLPVSYNALDGIHTITATATDFMGRTFAREERFTLDNSPPVGSFHAMVGNLLAGDAWLIGGEAIDPTGVARMDFRIGRIGGNEPDEAALAEYYLYYSVDDPTEYTPGRDTSRNNSIFDYAGTDRTWFPMVADPQGTARHDFIQVANHSPFNWELAVAAEDSVAFVNWLQESANAGLIYRPIVGGIEMIDLPIWFRAVDNQGNAGYFGRTVRINPDADVPRLEINTPSETTANIANQRGGRVDLGGFARIDSPIPVHSVLYRVWVGGLGGANPSRPTRLVTAAELGATPASDADMDFLYDLDVDWEDGWFSASVLIPPGVTGNNAPWNFTLNAGGEIAALIETAGFAAAGGTTHDTIRVWVEMIALNGVGTDSRASALEVVSFYLRDSAPQVLLATVTSGDTAVTYWDGAPQWGEDTLPHRGRFTIRALLDAASGQTLSDVRIARLDEVAGNLGATPAWEITEAGGVNQLHGVTVTAVTNQTQLTAAFGTGAPSIADFPAGQFWLLTYVLDPALPVIPDSTPWQPVGTVRNGGWATTGGQFRVEIRVRDAATPRVEYSLTLPILLDNFAPVVDPNHVTNPTQAGTSGRFIGRALDFSTAFASPSHVDRIYAWFVRGNEFVAIDERATPAALDGWNFRRAAIPGADGSVAGNDPGRRSWTDVLVGRTATVNGTSVTNVVEGNRPGTGDPIVSPAIPANAATAGGGAWVRVISGPRSAAESGTGRRDAIFWDARDGGRYVEWGFTIDTTRLPDGPLTLNYIVVDHNGNASFHQQHIVIMNRFPEISDIILHTSNTDFHGVVETNGGFEQGTYMRLPVTAAERGRTEGFIESRFTARNNFIGFTVNTSGGNAPLRYRLQHVTRQSVPLNATTLEEMFANSTGVDMFTIEAIGDVTADTWRRLGVHANRTPAPGMHFAFRPVDPNGRPIRVGTGEGEIDAAVARFILGVTGTARIFRYTAHRSVNPDPLGVAGNAVNPSVNPNDFNFAGAAFGGTVATPGTGVGEDGPRIPQFVTYTNLAGPLPDEDALEALRRHDNRPFFLIRVWDSVIAGAPTGLGIDTGPHSNDRLHDAVVIAADIFLTDTTNPEGGFHPLRPNLERSVVRNNLGAEDLAETMADALDPAPAGLVYNVDRGGIFNIGTEREPRISGYIDPGFEIDTGVYRDQVSGQVILRGHAHDNQRIRSIELSIVQGDTPNFFTILQWPAVGGTGLVPVRIATETANSIRPTTGPLAWRSTVDGDYVYTDVGIYETLDWEDGHDVEWSFRWDTETFTATHGPASNVVISVRITDAVDRVRVDTHTVDIVPYITGFERSGPGNLLTGYATIRSMQGWYSFYQGETGISALGFNLGTAAPDVDGPITGASTVDVRRTLLNGLGLRGFTFNVPTDATSGRIDVSVGATSIHNHRSDWTQAWNREDFLRADGRADLWTNRLHAHIWRTRADSRMPNTFMGLAGSSTNLDHPGMALQYTVNTAPGAVSATSTHPAGNLGTDMQLGTLHGVWSVYGNAMVHYGRNDGTGINPTADRTRISDGTPFDPIVQPDIGLFRGGGIPNLVYFWHQDGNPTVRFHSRPDQRSGGDGQNAPTQALIAGAAGNAGVTERWRNIRTVTAAGNPGALNANPNTAITNTNAYANPGRLFTTVYDALNRRLVFALRDGTSAVTQVYIDGNGANITGAGSATVSANAGLFSAVGYDITTAGLTLPIVAYYDFTHDTIRIAFANAQAPAAANWRRDNVLTPRTIDDVAEAQHPLFIGSGRYVSMAVDRFGTIHLAFFNSRHQALVYAYAPRPASGHTGQSRTFNAMIVDTLPGVGTWTDISVDHWGNPFIVYGYQGRDDNFDGVRMAFRSGGRGPGHTVANAAGDPAGIVFGRPLNCRVTGASISGWEAVSMAAPFRVSYDRLNIEAWPPSNRANPTGASAVTMGTIPATSGVWNAAIGYVGDRYFRIGYFFRPATIMGGWLGGDQN